MIKVLSGLGSTFPKNLSRKHEKLKARKKFKELRVFEISCFRDKETKMERVGFGHGFILQNL
jgi:hypothetical protein